MKYREKYLKALEDLSRLQVAMEDQERRFQNEENEMASRERWAARKEAEAIDSIRVHSEMRAAWSVRGFKTWWDFICAFDRYRDAFQKANRPLLPAPPAPGSASNGHEDLPPKVSRKQARRRSRR